MARGVVVAGIFTTAAYAARVAESQADLYASDLIPVRAVRPSMPIAKTAPVILGVVPALTVPQPSLLATPSIGTRSRLSPLMAMQYEGEDGRLLPDEDKAITGMSRRQVLTGLSAAAVGGLQFANAPTEPAVAASTAATGIVASGDGGAVSASTEFISGLIAGAVQSTVKQLVLYPFDTVKSRLQVSEGDRSLFDAALYKDAYSGIGPTLLSSAPTASLFFAVKDLVKQQVTEGLGNTLGTLTAVGAANVPYWLVRNPTEVIKTRRQTGQIDDPAKATVDLWQEQGPSGFYRGYASNLAYAFPVDAAKFVLYDSFKKELKQKNGGKKLSPIESAVFGGIATAVAQSVATPLDVARTRIMNADPSTPAGSDNVLQILADVAATEGVGGLFAGIAPKLARAVVSGALQFSVLEQVKDSVNEALLGALAAKASKSGAE